MMYDEYVKEHNLLACNNVVINLTKELLLIDLLNKCISWFHTSKFTVVMPLPAIVHIHIGFKTVFKF